jgi:uncharacterized protein (TIGR00661 family)
MKILFGVFDWGLGHATRDAPLIEALLREGHAVEILSTGRALRLLQNRFENNCAFYDVPSIASPYTKTRFFLWSFIARIPAMLHSLKVARRLSADIIRRGRYDLIVSDCRYDVYDAMENSLLINHQLRFKSFSAGEEMAERWLAVQMNRYRRVLVPDFPHENLSGELSRSLKRFDAERIEYIGILSHLRRRSTPKDVDYFISLTGPEPQRSVLEKLVREQILSLPGRIVVAGGVPGNDKVETSGQIAYHGFMDAALQEETLNRAKFFVSRSGYTSMMELAEVGLNDALLIPTPGQTEQEYLARLYEKKGWFHFVDQWRLRLAADVEKARGYKGFHPPWRTAESVRRFLAVCTGRPLPQETIREIANTPRAG